MYLLWENMLSSAVLRLSTVTLVILSHQIFESCEAHSHTLLQDRYLAILSNEINYYPHATTRQLLFYCTLQPTVPYSAILKAVFKFCFFSTLTAHHTYHFHLPHNGLHSNLAFLSDVCVMRVLTPIRQKDIGCNDLLCLICFIKVIVHVFVVNCTMLAISIQF